jgi:hypothetical protein
MTFIMAGVAVPARIVGCAGCLGAADGGSNIVGRAFQSKSFPIA